LEYAAAPHPDPLPVKYGEREKRPVSPETAPRKSLWAYSFHVTREPRRRVP
jgi:hypothetical protein